MRSRQPATRTAPPAAPSDVPPSVDDYIAAQPEAVQPLLRQIRAIVHDEAPQAEETISYRMPAYRQGGVLLYFAAFKQHIGLYPPVQGDDDLLLALAPYRGAKGNLSFPLAEDLPLTLIRRVARQRVSENAAKARARKAR